MTKFSLYTDEFTQNGDKHILERVQVTLELSVVPTDSDYARATQAIRTLEDIYDQYHTEEAEPELVPEDVE